MTGSSKSAVLIGYQELGARGECGGVWRGRSIEDSVDSDELFFTAKMVFVVLSFFLERVSTDWLKFAVISNSLCVL